MKFCVFCGLALALGCRQPAIDRTAPPVAGAASSAPAVDVSPAFTGSSARKRGQTDTASKLAVVAAPVAEAAKSEDDLRSEEREANPLSETVTLTLAISPPVKAVVMWGAKQLARVAPDRPIVELQRPRDTGPLDLEIRAEGFLPHHTRLHSDRNDKVNVRLVRPADAQGMLGYRSSVAATAAKGKTK